MFSQLFETTIVAGGDSRAFRFAFVPQDQMSPEMGQLFEPGGADSWRSGDAYGLGGFEISDGLHFPDGDPEHSIQVHMALLPYMFAAMACYPIGDEALNYFRKVKFEGHKEPPNGDHDFLEVANKLVHAPVIPITQSPLNLSSLTEILKSGSGVGIGATVGFFVGWGTPYLLVTVPAGMLICGAAAGISKALDKGLERRFLAWLGVKD
jgi:hypothetical protein